MLPFVQKEMITIFKWTFSYQKKVNSQFQRIKKNPLNEIHSALWKLSTLFLFFSFHHEQMTKTSIWSTI